ncbi:hypothetical protein CDO52_01170 [Nocardiopsis gilva YIM 90087]|uniref:Uncharacterized protein n=1 Tax=Nocardiopsis gilva YIM 90087 TaxID=1235441 RepID=A0A223S0E2_9ACTN|nr:hypothetical protein [Nocardiopsis gilva]ASU81586.1 hypothetical protein CDO52_01170 [Nocardiopsis gilva YIM 90087]
MSTLKTWTVTSLRKLETWARYHNTTVTTVEEAWDHITHQAETLSRDGVRFRCTYREQMPPGIALKRRAHTYTVTLFHGPGGASCYHVRKVTPDLGAGGDPAHLAELVAAAEIQRQRRPVCGATAENLTVLTTERTYPTDCPAQVRLR